MTPVDEKTFRELCLLHALGTIAPKDETSLFGTLADADEDRLVFFAEMTEHRYIEAAGNAGLSPHPDVKRKLSARIESDWNGIPETGSGRSGRMGTAPRPVSSPPPRPGAGSPDKRARFPRAMAYASLLFGAGLIAFSAMQWRRAEKSAWTAHFYKARVEALEDSLGAREALLGVLSSPQVHLASLKSGAHPGTSGRVYWDPAGRRGVLHVSDLPPAPKGQAYYLWILVNDRADPCVNAGSFSIRRLRPEGDYYRFQGAESLSRMKILGFEITSESLEGHGHTDGHDHVHPTGKSLLKTETFL